MNKRFFYSANEYYKEIFGSKVYKIALNLGTTCPTRDGTKDSRGCIFCSNAGSGDFAFSDLEKAKNLVSQKIKGNDKKFLAYFQSFTNTYGKTREEEKKLVEKYKAVLEDSEIVGIVIGTRPDSISDWILDEIGKIAENHYVSIELGFQTSNVTTSEYIRRHFSNEEYFDAIKRIKATNQKIHVVTHLIFGLPFETESDMLNSVKTAIKAQTDGIKIALLHVLKNTDLATDFHKGKFSVMEKEEYFEILGKALAIIPENVVIHRLTGDGPKRLLITPLWTGNKKDVINSMMKYFEDNGIFQGSGNKA
jgi:radical SAM protein (TIGR01212 family)